MWMMVLAKWAKIDYPLQNTIWFNMHFDCWLINSEKTFNDSMILQNKINNPQNVEIKKVYIVEKDERFCGSNTWPIS